ncbi:MAG TPA: hypothetical protein VGM37_17935 [Armatimonadota bacterium]|jgi:hypothetical protein
MTNQEHITPETVTDLQAGRLTVDEAARAEAHIAGCAECAALAREVTAFVANLNDDWNRHRLEAMGAGHPSPSELEAFWMDEPVADSVKTHVAGCGECGAHLQRLEDGFAALADEDPLGRGSWADLVQARFAAGIEMVVEATNGAYTSAAGIIREVMTPQARAVLTPAPALAMGAETHAHAGVLWHDAAFQTDELSGEVTGSTDNATGRGIITVLIHKSGDFVATTPIVELVSSAGKRVSTQSALDIGDRFSAVFTNLDQGRYLVAIREPGSQM